VVVLLQVLVGWVPRGTPRNTQKLKKTPKSAAQILDFLSETKHFTFPHKRITYALSTHSPPIVIATFKVWM
jgi:hypothetical protein